MQLEWFVLDQTKSYQLHILISLTETQGPDGLCMLVLCAVCFVHAELTDVGLRELFVPVFPEYRLPGSPRSHMGPSPLRGYNPSEPDTYASLNGAQTR